MKYKPKTNVYVPSHYHRLYIRVAEQILENSGTILISIPFIGIASFLYLWSNYLSRCVQALGKLYQVHSVHRWRVVVKETFRLAWLPN